jgi:hypothetical protein
MKVESFVSNSLMALVNLNGNQNNQQNQNNNQVLNNLCLQIDQLICGM